MNKLIGQIMKFGVVGVLCFFIDYGLMIYLVEVAKMDYLISCAISFSVSVVVNYCLSMWFVFKRKQGTNRLKEFTIFVVLSVIGLLINELIMFVAVDFLKVYYMLSKIVATIIVMAYNFVTRKIFLEEKDKINL